MAHYSDLRAIGVRTSAQAIAHWLIHGKREGRFPNATALAAASAAAAPKDPSSETRRRLFTQIYEENIWGKVSNQSESRSGEGSTLKQTQTLRPLLEALLEDLCITSLLDAPCGDFNWMRHVRLPPGCKYIGCDIVPSLIAENQSKYGDTTGVGDACSRTFVQLDLCEDPLPQVDLILSRDFLVHLPFDDALAFLRNAQKSNSTYLLATTYPKHGPNVPSAFVGGSQVGLYGWQPLNLQIAPFNLPPPIAIINEGCTEYGDAFADKSLALWKLSDICVAARPE
jgi:hypothetical protein